VQAELKNIIMGPLEVVVRESYTSRMIKPYITSATIRY